MSSDPADTSGFGASLAVREAFQRATDAGYVSGDPVSMNAAGLTALTDLTTVLMYQAARGSEPLDQIIASLSSALLSAIGGAMTDDPIPSIRQAEKSARSAVKTARSV